jgi:hypothetical protein
MDKGGPGRPTTDAGQRRRRAGSNGPGSRPGRLADHLSFAWHATPSAGRRRPDEESDRTATDKRRGYGTGGLSGARRTDHSQRHPSPERERSKGPSAPEAKPLPTLAYRCLRNAATCGKCFLRVHVAMVEFLAQDRLLIGCERAAALRQHLRHRNRARPPASATRPSTPRPARGETPRMRQAFRSPDRRGLRDRAEPLPGHAERQVGERAQAARRPRRRAERRRSNNGSARDPA